MIKKTHQVFKLAMKKKFVDGFWIFCEWHNK